MGTVLVGLVMVIGLLGVVVPLLPGTALVLGAGIAWAIFVEDDGAVRWLVVSIMAGLFVAGVVAKYALPGQRLASQLPRTSLLAGGAGALLGFLVFPPLGLLLGGVAGTYIAEARRLGRGREARRSTTEALKAVGLGVLAELTAGLLMVGTWLAGLALT